MEFIKTPESSNVAGFGYNEVKKILTVEFKGNSVFDYYDVPENIFEGMKAAKSRGTYMTAHVKGIFRYDQRR